MTQKARPHGAEPQFRGILDCWSKTVKQEGFLALYKGFFPAWLHLAPWQLIFWTTCTRVRREVAPLGCPERRARAGRRCALRHVATFGARARLARCSVHARARSSCPHAPARSTPPADERLRIITGVGSFK